MFDDDPDRRPTHHHFYIPPLSQRILSSFAFTSPAKPHWSTMSYPSSNIILSFPSSFCIAFILNHNPRPNASSDRTCKTPISDLPLLPNWNPYVSTITQLSDTYFPLIHHLTPSWQIHLMATPKLKLHRSSPSRRPNRYHFYQRSKTSVLNYVRDEREGLKHAFRTSRSRSWVLAKGLTVEEADRERGRIHHPRIYSKTRSHPRYRSRGRPSEIGGDGVGRVQPPTSPPSSYAHSQVSKSIQTLSDLFE
jgi:hypothetical protein